MDSGYDINLGLDKISSNMNNIKRRTQYLYKTNKRIKHIPFMSCPVLMEIHLLYFAKNEYMLQSNNLNSIK